MYSWIVLAGKSCFTATTCGKSDSLVTGSQVFWYSNGRSLIRNGLVTWLAASIRKVWPSRGDCSTALAATRALPPVRFSMISCWPMISDTRTLRVRATVSAAPPAAKATTQRTGPLGQSDWAKP